MTDSTVAATSRTHARLHSLNEVRAIIPERCYRRSAGRASIALAQGWLLWLLPVAGLVFAHAWWLVLPLWLCAGLGVAGLFVLGHDASHGALVESRRANRLIAQACMAPGAHVEAAWDLGHNRIHHGYTTRQGFDFVWHPLTVAEYRSLGRLARLQHRLEWSWVGSGAYFLRTVWWQKMWRYNAEGKRRAAIVKDKTALTVVMALVVAGTVVAGALMGGWITAIWLPIKLFLVPFLLFVHIIGWTVYVHHVAPDIRWWPRKEWTQFRGQMESTTILRVPRLVNRLWFHNIFVHIPHHVDARLPFHQLQAAAEAIQAAYPDTVRAGRLSLRSYLHTAKSCKLYDFEAGCWLSYDAAA
jgi:omega-6 fatty acid desaturase (delta-12 desaturase)